MSEAEALGQRVTVTGEGLSEPLGQWLARRLPGAPTVYVSDLRRPHGGYSAETWLFKAAVDGDVEQFVLRRESPDPPIYPTQVPGLTTEVDLQYRIMKALSHSGRVPIAPLIGYEADTALLGQPFFVMRFVDGQIPVESPAYTTEGFFVEATPARRGAIIANGLKTLAELHRVDWRNEDLGWLVPPGVEPGAAAQLEVWERYGTAVLRGRVHPLIDAGLRWLHDHPPRCGPPVFSWGDSRPGNIIFDGAQPACLTDFEAASIAPPEMDLGWWLHFDRTMHEAVSAPRLAGEPTRHDQYELYAKASGRDLGDVHWFEVFAGVRYAMIVVRVLNRAVEHGRASPDNQAWLHNSIVDCLELVLNE